MIIRKFVPTDLKRVFEIENMSFSQSYGINMFQQLYEMGILVDAECDELEKWSKEYCNGKNDNSIIDMTIQLTQQCQFQCIYCFEGMDKGNRVLTDKASQDIRNYIERRAPELKVLHITWFGG